MFRVNSSKSLVIVAAACLGLASVNVWAAGDTFSFSESQKDSLDCSNKTSDSCEIFTSGSYSAKGVVFVGDTAVLDTIGLGSDIEVTIGGSTFGGAVSTADKISRSKATFDLTDLDCAKMPCQTKVHGTVTFSVSSKGLSVSVKTKTGATADETFEDSIIADAHATDNAAFTDTFDVLVIVDSVHTDSFTVAVSGVAATKSTSKNGGTFDLNSVKAKSTGISP